MSPSTRRHAAHHTPDATEPRYRASDAERTAVAEVLQDAVSRGLLTPAEGTERTAAAAAAVHRDDLTPLTADLPPAPRARKHRDTTDEPGDARRHGKRRGRGHRH